MNNFQRIGSVSNSHVGRDFEAVAKAYFLRHESLLLNECYPVAIGVGDLKKCRRFDLGSDEPATIVECKSHRWTETGNMPSAKVTVWNESMYYFLLAPSHFRKILFVLRDLHLKRTESLAEFYIRNYSHLIPPGVSVVEFDETSMSAQILIARSAADRKTVSAKE